MGPFGRWLDGLAYQLGLRSPKPPGLVPVRESGAEAAIVFVHGFTGDARGTWGHFPNLIKSEAGLRSWDVFVYGYTSGKRVDAPFGWTGDPGPERLARSLRTEARAAPLGRYPAVAFVGHSMGGLVVQRALVDDPDLARRTSHVVLFGTPSGGLVRARRFRLLKRQIRGMAPSSLRPLRAAWDEAFGTGPGAGRTPPFRFLAVDGEADDFVPAESALAPFDDRFRATVLGDHLSMVKPEGAGDRSFRLVADSLAGGTSPHGPVDAARVAVELRDFHAAVERFGGHVDQLDSAALVQYALALDGVGRRDDAVEALRSHPRVHSEADALGTLGGRIKRRWLSSRRGEDAEEALELYRRGYDLAVHHPEDPKQAYYHAINLGFLNLLYRDDRAVAEEWASLALEACGRAPAGGPSDLWGRATVAEAHLLMGSHDLALREYAEVVRVGGAPWELRSAYHQAMRIAGHERATAVERRLGEIFGLPYPPL